MAWMKRLWVHWIQPTRIRKRDFSTIQLTHEGKKKVLLLVRSFTDSYSSHAEVCDALDIGLL